MCDTAIQKLVCQAVVSDHYRTRLLGPDRAEVLRTSGLDAREQEALLSIQAVTIEEFAAGVERVTRLWKREEKRLAAREAVVLRGLIAMEITPRSG